MLAIGTAAGFGAVGVAHWRAGRLRWTYLLDAAVEAAAVAAWIAALRAEGGAGGAAPSA